jgi:uncharacterized membrane protein
MARLVVRLLFAALFLFTGTVHLFDPGLFRPVMPPWIPFPRACVIVSGIAELLGAVGLLVPNSSIQQAAGLGLTLLLIAIFPANIYMATHHIRIHGFPSHSWMTWVRLPLQALFIWGVIWCTKRVIP